MATTPWMRVGAAAAMVLLAGCSGGTSAESPAASGSSSPPSSVVPSGSSGVRVVAVGDIACPPDEEPTPTTCQQQRTADLTGRLDPEVVLALGDLQYESGAEADFEDSWAASWGRFEDRLAPVPGNHEYGTAGAAGYRAYLGAATHGVREIGGWRVYLLDSNCEQDLCAGETRWLERELAAHPTACTAVTMHHPRWSSGAHGPQGFMQDLWEALVDGGVDVALAGHDHDYERFARLDDTGHPTSGTDAEGTGTRQFVVGTGGKSFYGLREPRTGSQFLQHDRFGVLELTLRPGGYDWSFVDTDDEVLDSGSDTCSP